MVKLTKAQKAVVRQACPPTAEGTIENTSRDDALIGAGVGAIVGTSVGTLRGMGIGAVFGSMIGEGIGRYYHGQKRAKAGILEVSPSCVAKAEENIQKLQAMPKEFISSYLETVKLGEPNTSSPELDVKTPLQTPSAPANANKVNVALERK